MPLGMVRMRSAIVMQNKIRHCIDYWGYAYAVHIDRSNVHIHADAQPHKQRSRMHTCVHLCFF